MAASLNTPQMSPTYFDHSKGEAPLQKKKKGIQGIIDKGHRIESLPCVQIPKARESKRNGMEVRGLLPRWTLLDRDRSASLSSYTALLGSVPGGSSCFSAGSALRSHVRPFLFVPKLWTFAVSQQEVLELSFPLAVCHLMGMPLPLGLPLPFPSLHS